MEQHLRRFVGLLLPIMFIVVSMQAQIRTEPPAKPILQQTIPCKSPDAPKTFNLLLEKPGEATCEIISFDRIRNNINGKSPQAAFPDEVERRDIVETIKGSKVLISGSILRIRLNNHDPNDCKAYDWKIVAQPKESPTIVIYGSADVGSGSCGKAGSDALFFSAIPVTALWAEVTPYAARNDDPTHKGPGDAPSAQVNPTVKICDKGDPSSIVPCDRYEWPVSWLYDTAWLFYNPLTQPGSAQGTINLSPVIGGGSQKLSYDLQLNPALPVPGGWIALPVVFEKDSNNKANLDSFTAALSYEVRFVKAPNLFAAGNPDRFIIRKPQIQLRVGPELAPTSPRDLNLISGATTRLPFVIGFHRQPSSITFFPVMGVEGGQSIKSHLPVSDSILRGVAGVDASFRWPFDVTHNFLGDKPITIDYSYRMRWLAYNEPMTDIAAGETETVSNQRHSYWRGSLNAPVSSNFQFKLTVQHGALPPVFRILDYSLSLGLTFTNPGTTEH